MNIVITDEYRDVHFALMQNEPKNQGCEFVLSPGNLFAFPADEFKAEQDF